MAVLTICTICTIRAVFTILTITHVDDRSVRHCELVAVGGLCHGCDVAGLLLSIHNLLDGGNLIVQGLQLRHALIDAVHAVTQFIDATLVVVACRNG